jgi:hypothetical protein
VEEKKVSCSTEILTGHNLVLNAVPEFGVSKCF